MVLNVYSKFGMVDNNNNRFVMKYEISYVTRFASWYMFLNVLLSILIILDRL